MPATQAEVRDNPAKEVAMISVPISSCGTAV
jgi:hypothetical protein